MGVMFLYKTESDLSYVSNVITFLYGTNLTMEMQPIFTNVNHGGLQIAHSMGSNIISYKMQAAFCKVLTKPSSTKCWYIALLL